MCAWFVRSSMQLNFIIFLQTNMLGYMSLNTPDHGLLFALIQWCMHMYNPVFQLKNSAWGSKWPLQPIFGGQIFQERANVPVSFEHTKEKKQFGS